MIFNILIYIINLIYYLLKLNLKIIYFFINQTIWMNLLILKKLFNQNLLNLILLNINWKVIKNKLTSNNCTFINNVLIKFLK